MGDRIMLPQKYEDGDAWEDSDEVVEDVYVKKPLDKVVQIRLEADMWEKLRIEASSRGVGPTDLARMWLTERLKYGPRHQLAQLSHMIPVLRNALCIRYRIPPVIPSRHPVAEDISATG